MFIGGINTAYFADSNRIYTVLVLNEQSAGISQKVKEANAKLTELKEMWLPVKNEVKAAFDQPKWLILGIQDKR